MQVVEQYCLDMVGITFKHSKSPGAKLMEKAWSLSFSEMVHGRRQWADVGILKNSLQSTFFDFSPNNGSVTFM